MNTKKNLSEYTDEELLITQKQTKNIVIIFGSFMFLAFIFFIYTAIKTSNYAFIAIGCGTSVSLMPLIAKLSMINKEIKSRQK
ncbi:hypothetical protein OBK11_04130 [Empedobacter falsenii]|uniref:hypothetical protein n=1 Tax=Empedobacter sp. UBA3239 TaxID=1946434 RepID=UPI0025BE66B3|nr:hypothetical protein [Empedobacter sp. UBA3239]